MLATEKEAKTKFCAAGQNNPTEYVRCQGTECMAWRWHDPKYEEDGRRGYCGLAGKPEVT